MFDLVDLWSELGDLFSSSDPTQQAFLKTFASDTHVSKKDGKVTIEIEVPGTKPEDVDISVHGQMLVIDWKRTVRGVSETLTRQLRISRDVDVDSIQARVENGLLSMELKRGTAPSVKKIPVLGSKTGI